MTKINLLKRASQSGSKVSLSADLVHSPGASGQNQGSEPSPNRVDGAGSAAQPVAAKTDDGADQTLSAEAQKKRHAEEAYRIAKLAAEEQKKAEEAEAKRQQEEQRLAEEAAKRERQRMEAKLKARAKQLAEERRWTEEAARREREEVEAKRKAREEAAVREKR